jgi:hypothetical protein
MRNKLGLAAIIAAPLAAASITFTAAPASSGSPATDRVQVIRLVVKAVSNTDVDLGQKGFSQGDQEIVRYDVFQSGKKIGEAGEVRQFTRVTKAFHHRPLPGGANPSQGAGHRAGTGQGHTRRTGDVLPPHHRWHERLPDGARPSEDHRQRGWRGRSASHALPDPLIRTAPRIRASRNRHPGSLSRRSTTPARQATLRRRQALACTRPPQAGSTPKPSCRGSSAG